MDRHANMVAFAVVMMLLPIAYSTANFDDALNAINAANPAISSAQASVDALNYKLADANTYGISSQAYSSAAGTAQTLLTKAKASYHSASADFAGANYDAAVRDATSAQSQANQAQSTADPVTNEIDSLLKNPPTFTVTPDQSSIEIADSSTANILVRLASQDSRKLECDYKTTQSSLQSLETLYSSGSQSFQALIQAPSTGSGTLQYTIDVTCSVGSYTSGSRATSISVHYKPDPAQIAVRQAEDAAKSADASIQALSQAIDSAVAHNPDIDLYLGDARKDLSAAQSASSQAHVSLKNAQDRFLLKDSDNAIFQANSSITSSQLALQNTSTGQAMVADAVEAFKTEGGQVRLAINLANENIANAQSWIDMADGIVSNATGLGMDTRDQVAAVATSKGMLANAKSYLQNANSGVSSNSYAQAKTDAASANNNAVQAEAKAKGAYESLSSVMETCQAAFEQMQTAQEQISAADVTYTKLAAVIRSLPQEMNAGSAAQDVETQRQKLDSAKNEYSDAQAKLSAGYCTQSVNSGISARNDASDASNQLGRVAERMKNTIVSALDATSQQTQNKVEGAKIATAGAGGTFLSDPAKTTYAQQQLTDAQTALLGAQGAVENAKQATSLSVFLDKSADAFGKLQNVNSIADSSLQSADSARNDAYVKYGAAIVAVIGAVGIGFLFWKRGSGKKAKPSDSKVERLLNAGKYEEAAKLCASKREYKHAAEYYAKAGKFEKAKEMSKKSGKKR